MFEIELKAHVRKEERPAVINALNGFAKYLGAVEKEDAYYALNGGKRCRLRTETPFKADGQPEPDALPAQRTFFTYKRKERRTFEDGTAIEVNDEKECELTDASPLAAYLADNGFSVVLKKHKTVLGWQSDSVHIELCTVPPLGDFLELETFAESNDTETVARGRNALKAVLFRAGLAESTIEDRYYSDMLRQACAAQEAH